MERLAYRPREVAEVLGLPLSTVYDLIHRHVLRAVNIKKPGARRGLVRIPADAIQEFLSGDDRGAA